MGQVCCSVDKFCFPPFVVLVFFGEMQDAEQVIILVKSDVLAFAKLGSLLVIHRKCYGDWPGDSVCKTHV